MQLSSDFEHNCDILLTNTGNHCLFLSLALMLQLAQYVTRCIRKHMSWYSL